MSGKHFWRSGGEKCFSLDIPLYRTSGSLRVSHARDDSERWRLVGYLSEPVIGEGELHSVKFRIVHPKISV